MYVMYDECCELCTFPPGHHRHRASHIARIACILPCILLNILVLDDLDHIAVLYVACCSRTYLQKLERCNPARSSIVVIVCV
jgi:hypothetical protein